MIEIRADRPGELAWIEARSGVVLTRNARAVVADEDGQIVGMVAIDCVTMNSAEAHMAVVSPRVWHRLLRPAFHYIFQQPHNGHLLGVLLAVVPQHNARSLRFVRGIGFRVQYEVRDGWANGDDLLIFEMRRENCRFLRSA